MTEPPSPAPEASRRWLGVLALLLVASGVLNLWRQHQEREATKAARHDLGTERDPGALLNAPAEFFFCKGATPSLCELHGKWVAAAGCSDKEAGLAALKAALKDFRASPEYTHILLGIASVQIDTENACKAQP
jgi:hypothetical protein